MAQAARGNQMIGPVLRHLGELIRPNQRWDAHAGANNVVRLQHRLWHRRRRLALDRRGERPTAGRIAQSRWRIAVLCARAGRGGEKEQDEDRAHNIYPRAADSIISTWDAEPDLDAPEPPSVAPSRRRQHFVSRWVARAMSDSLRGVCKGGTEDGAPSVCPLGVPGSFPCTVLPSKAGGGLCALTYFVSHDFAR